jgi:hypothetical protein
MCRRLSTASARVPPTAPVHGRHEELLLAHAYGGGQNESGGLCCLGHIGEHEHMQKRQEDQYRLSNGDISELAVTRSLP